MFVFRNNNNNNNNNSHYNEKKNNHASNDKAAPLGTAKILRLGGVILSI